MLNKESLIAAGLTEAQATAVLSLHKESINGNYIPKDRFDEVNGELKTAKASITDRDKQISDLKKFEGDQTALQTKIKELEAANETATKAAELAIGLEKKKNQVKLSLLEDAEGKPHDIDMVVSLLNLDKISLDETGKIKEGFKEQRDNIRKEKAFLFEEKKAATPPGTPPPTGWKPIGTPPAEGGTPPPASDPSISYGKSLAQVRIGMMGGTPAAEK